MDLRTESTAPPVAAGESAPLDVFYQAAEQAFNIVVITDGKGNVEYVNPMFTRVTGMSRGEALGRQITNLGTVFPDHAADAWKAFSEGRQWLGEFEYVNAAGAKFHVMTSISPIRDDAGRIVQFVGVTIDITDRKKAEEALQQKTSLMEAIFDCFPDLLFRLDGAGTILEYTANLGRELYIPPEVFLGKRIKDVVPLAVSALFAEAIAEAVRDGALKSIEYQLPIEGGARYFEARILPYSADNILVIVRDVHDGKQAEQALRESEARLRALGDAIPDITMVLDGDGRYLETLALAENSKLFYAPPETIKGRVLHDVLPRSKADLFLAVIRKTIETRQPQMLEYSLRVQAGNRWFEGRTALLTLEGQGPLVVWAARDITERKRMEAELRQMREELEHKAEMQFQSRNKYRLTFREFTVLNLVVCGKPDKEIAALLGISRLTASKHVANIMKKMKTSSRTEAGVQAFRDGLID